MLPVVIAPFELHCRADVLKQPLDMVGLGVAKVKFIFLVEEIPGIFDVVLFEDVYHLLQFFHRFEDKFFQSRISFQAVELSLAADFSAPVGAAGLSLDAGVELAVDDVGLL